MRKRKPNGRISQTDLALVIHEILDIPLDPVTKYPTQGVKIVAAILQAMTKALRSGDYVHIKGFGKFTVTKPRLYNVPKPVIFNPGKFGHEHGIKGEEPQKFLGKGRAKFKPSIQVTAMMNADNPSPRELSMAISKWHKDDN